MADLQWTRGVGDAPGNLLVEVEAVLEEEAGGGGVDGVGTLAHEPHIEHPHPHPHPQVCGERGSFSCRGLSGRAHGPRGSGEVSLGAV